MRSSNIGGQAVIEGIMMKNGDAYAVAVRKENGCIEVMHDEYKLKSGQKKFLALPFIRGIFNFVDSLYLGIKTLTWSASFFEDEEELEKEKEKESFFEKHMSKEAAEKLLMTFTVMLSLAMSIGIFILLPAFIAGLIYKLFPYQFTMALVEGLLRIVLFVLYVWLISKNDDIKRVFMYHGAEHKCINCVEDGKPLTVDNVMESSRLHKRCGTSFLLFVMIISIVLFMFVHTDTLIMRLVSRILLIPVVAGISYELLKLAGSSDNGMINIISKPGLALQRLTTSEPTPDMVEVAIQAVETVFDWKKWQEENPL